MIEISSFMQDLITILVIFWPVVRILARLGLSRAYAVLLLLSLVIPLLGHMVVAMIMVFEPWPLMPVIVKPVKRERLV